METKHTGSKAASKKRRQRAHIAALRAELAKYFMNCAATSERFWITPNPSLGGRSPASLVKEGKLKAVEEYVTFLREHARYAKPQVSAKPADYRFQVIEGSAEEVRERLKEIPASQRVIAILFHNAESYYSYAPVYREILNRLPEIMWRRERTEQMLFARLLFSLTADLPIGTPKQKAIMRASRRKAARGPAALGGGAAPDLPDIRRRSTPRV